MAEGKMPDVVKWARWFAALFPPDDTWDEPANYKESIMVELLAFRREVLLAAAQHFQRFFGPGHWVMKELERLAEEAGEA